MSLSLEGIVLSLDASDLPGDGKRPLCFLCFVILDRNFSQLKGREGGVELDWDKRRRPRERSAFLAKYICSMLEIWMDVDLSFSGDSINVSTLISPCFESFAMGLLRKKTYRMCRCNYYLLHPLVFII